MGVRNFGNREAMGLIYFGNNSQFKVDFKNAKKKKKKNSEIFFCFWDKCVWIGYVKLSLLSREYLSSAANVLTVLRFCLLTRETFSNSLPLHWSTDSGKGAVVEIETLFRPVYHVAWWGVLLNVTFKTFI